MAPDRLPPKDVADRITLTRELFPQNSVGYILLPEDLEGRTRPAGMLLRPLDGLTIQGKAIQNISRLMYVPIDHYQSLRPAVKRDVDAHLIKFFHSALNGPEGNLINATFGKSPNERDIPISISADNMRYKVIQKMLTLLSREPRGGDVLRARFGIINGIPQTLQQIADGYSLSIDRISQIQKKSQILMRHSLQYFKSTPSLATKAWGGTCGYDVIAKFGGDPSIDNFCYRHLNKNLFVGTGLEEIILKDLDCATSVYQRASGNTLLQHIMLADLNFFEEDDTQEIIQKMRGLQPQRHFPSS